MLTQRKILWWVCGVALLAMLFPSLFRVVFAARDEVSYSAGLSMTTCQGFLANGFSTPETCRATYRIIIGNTGTNPQDEIRVTLSPVPETWLLGTSSLDIVASARRRVAPEISHEQVNDSLLITVSKLEPNRLVELDLMTRGLESAELLTDTRAQVDFAGSVIESNPRLTVTARFFRNLFSVAGF